MQKELDDILVELDEASQELDGFRGLVPPPPSQTLAADEFEAAELEEQPLLGTGGFDEVLQFNDGQIRNAAAELDREELALSLKTASPAVRAKILRSLDEMDAQQVLERLGHMTAARVLDVERAQEKMLGLVQGAARQSRFDILDKR